MKNVIDAIKAVEGVKSVNLHDASGRHYINLKGNGGSYRGEVTSKLYLDADGKLVFECGKGSRSSAYDEQRHAVEDAIAATI